MNPRRHLHSVLALFFSLNVLWCKPPTAPRWILVKSEKVRNAKLSRKIVIEIATKHLCDKNFEIAKYQCQSVMYSHDTEEWFVGFEPKEKSERVFGSDVSVLIKDKDCSTRIIPGMGMPTLNTISGLTLRSTRTLPLRPTGHSVLPDFSSPTHRAASAAPVSLIR